MSNDWDRIVPPGRYRHYKGNIYRVFGVGHAAGDSFGPEDLPRVMYQRESDGTCWYRPVTEFLASVGVGSSESPDAPPVLRFTQISADPPPIRERTSLVLPILHLASPPEDGKPWRCFLTCPACKTPHIDRGEWATTRHHRKHLCERCGFIWLAAEVPTVGVEEPSSCGGG